MKRKDCSIVGLEKKGTDNLLNETIDKSNLLLYSPKLYLQPAFVNFKRLTF